MTGDDQEGLLQAIFSFANNQCLLKRISKSDDVFYVLRVRKHVDGLNGLDGILPRLTDYSQIPGLC